jgi:hypothetical protein
VGGTYRRDRTNIRLRRNPRRLRRGKRQLPGGSPPMPCCRFVALTGTFGVSVSAKSRSPTASCDYLLSSLASATRAWWPASETALTNASALAGVAALPERMLRNIMWWP